MGIEVLPSQRIYRRGRRRVDDPFPTKATHLSMPMALCSSIAHGVAPRASARHPRPTNYAREGPSAAHEGARAARLADRRTPTSLARLNPRRTTPTPFPTTFAHAAPTAPSVGISV